MLRICLLLLFTSIGGTEINKTNENITKSGLFENIWNIESTINNFKELFKVIFSSYTMANTSNTSYLPIPEDANLRIKQLTEKYGYGVEEHEVITEDRYILRVHRLISKRNNTKNGRVAFLMHGILDSSDSWILQGPELALGYILADEGYDVWLGNARGNRYSMSHEILSFEDTDYWQFTWEEIGLHDLPAMIDHVLNITKNDGLYYIGHSQGTTSFYVMTSMKPEYNSKVKLMISLAPVAYMSHAKSPVVRMFSPAFDVIAYLLSGFNTFAPSTDALNRMAAVLCTMLPTSCDNFLYMIVGNDFKLVNKSLVPVIYGHIPAGSSLSQFVHFGQLVQSGRFSRFDFGEDGNVELYNQTTAPDYDLKNVKVPVVLYYSDNDWLSDSKDVYILKNKLPHVYEDIFIDSFNHFDFLFSSNATDIIYSSILIQMEMFDSRNYTISDEYSTNIL